MSRVESPPGASFLLCSSFHLYSDSAFSPSLLYLPLPFSSSSITRFQTLQSLFCLTRPFSYNFPDLTTLNLPVSSVFFLNQALYRQGEYQCFIAVADLSEILKTSYVTGRQQILASDAPKTLILCNAQFCLLGRNVSRSHDINIQVHGQSN